MLRVGVVGGGFGRLVHLPAWRARTDAAIEAVADGGSRSMAAAAAAATYYPGWQALLDHPALDAVSVAVPPALHATVVGAALRRGLHVLCEKPFCRDAASASELPERVPPERVGAVCYQFRYEPGLLALRETLRGGAIGGLRRVDVTWLTAGRADKLRAWGFQHDAAQGGGAVEALLCHAVDYATWLAGQPVRRVSARTDILVPARPDATGALRAVTAEDSVDAVLELAGGVVVTATVSNCQPRRALHRIELAGDAGWAALDLQLPAGPHLLTLGAAAGPTRRELPVASAEDSRLPAFAALLADFVAATGGAVAPDLPRFADAVRVRRTLDAVHRAVASGAWVAMEADC